MVSFSRDVGVLEAMADLSDDIEKLMRCTATEHASTQELRCTATEHAVNYAPTQSQHLRLLSTPLCQPATEQRGGKGNVGACFATQQSAELLQSIQLETTLVAFSSVLPHCHTACVH